MNPQLEGKSREEIHLEEGNRFCGMSAACLLGMAPWRE